MIPAHLARINYAGDLGYELWVAPEYQRELFDRIVAAGRAARPAAVRDAGADVAAAREVLRDVVPRVPADLHAARGRASPRYIKLDHEFIGRAAHEAELAAGGPARRLVAFVVEPDPDDPADVIGDEPIWHDGAVVGWVTSGGYGHHVGQSIALGYVPTELATPDGPGGAGFEIEIIGRRRPARLQPEPLFDPTGAADAPVTEASVRPLAGAAGRIVVDGSPVAYRGRRFGRRRDPARRRGPGARRDAVPRRRLRELPGGGRRRRLRPDLPDRGAAGVAGRAASGRSEPATPRGGRHGPDRDAAPATVELHHLEVDVAVIGGGSSGLAAAAEAERGGKTVRVLDAHAGDEVVAIYAGPMIVVRTAHGMLHVHPHEIVVATGAAEIHPVCPGNRLAGIVTARAAERAPRQPAWTWAGSSTVARQPRPLRGRRMAV